MLNANENANKENEIQSGLEKKLPLVLEIIPGQAKEGIMEIYEHASYQGKSLKSLVDNALGKERSLEDMQVVQEINRQLSGGKLLYNGKEIGYNATDHTIVEKTENGEEYLYCRLRVIKPQEGGGQYR